MGGPWFVVLRMDALLAALRSLSLSDGHFLSGSSHGGGWTPIGWSLRFSVVDDMGASAVHGTAPSAVSCEASFSHDFRAFHSPRAE